MPAALLIFAVCAFASGFATRIADPLVLPIAHQFALAPTIAALLSSAFALPYALGQPFLGPLGDRFGKERCIRICATGMSVALLLGTLSPSFAWLLLMRALAGVFAGGVIPLVLAGLGDAYELRERQVAIGRMLLAIISGQMLGAVAGGLVNDALGWRSAFALATAVSVAAAALAWGRQAAQRRAGAGAEETHTAAARSAKSIVAMYAHVFDNPKAVWLYAAIVVEGAFVFGLFPYMAPLLIDVAGSSVDSAPTHAGWVLGAFSIGGLAYALAVRRIIAWLGVARMCIWGSLTLALAYACLPLLPAWGLHALAMVAAGVGYYMLHNSLQTEATEIAPDARGSAVALFACGFFGGQALGPPLFGALAHAFGYGAALAFFGIGLALLGQGVVRKLVAGHVARRAGA